MMDKMGSEIRANTIEIINHDMYGCMYAFIIDGEFMYKYKDMISIERPEYINAASIDDTNYKSYLSDNHNPIYIKYRYNGEEMNNTIIPNTGCKITMTYSDDAETLYDKYEQYISSVIDDELQHQEYKDAVALEIFSY